MNWFISKFGEPSTWRGIFLILGIFGVKFSPEMTEQIITVTVAAVGLVEIFRKEKAGNDIPNVGIPEKGEGTTSTGTTPNTDLP